MKLLITFMVLVVAFSAFLAIDKARINAQRRKSLQERISGDGNVHAEEEYAGPRGVGGEPSPKAQVYISILRSMGVDVNAAMRKLELRFAQAGIVSADAPVYYLFFQRVISLIVGSIALVLIATAKGDAALTHQAIGAFLIGIAFFGPKLYIDNKIAHRTKVLQRAFPDTLDLLLICVESGLALDAALNRVCNELALAYPEMTQELNRTRLELSLLNDRVRALMNLGDRTGMVAFRSLVVALIQSERFGTSLTDTLRVLSEDFRLQRLTAAEAKAARLPVLLTVPLIVLLMPAFMMIIMGPAIIKMIHGSHAVSR